MRCGITHRFIHWGSDRCGERGCGKHGFFWDSLDGILGLMVKKFVQGNLGNFSTCDRFFSLHPKSLSQAGGGTLIRLPLALFGRGGWGMRVICCG